jgi:hypothetical protein
MVILPRLARVLHHPGFAGFLGVVLVGVGLYGLVSGKIGNAWSILFLVVGLLNISRLIVRTPDQARASGGDN